MTDSFTACTSSAECTFSAKCTFGARCTLSTECFCSCEASLSFDILDSLTDCLSDSYLAISMFADFLNKKLLI